MTRMGFQTAGLLYSQSTADIFTNKNLLENICGEEATLAAL